MFVKPRLFSIEMRPCGCLDDMVLNEVLPAKVGTPFMPPPPAFLPADRLGVKGSLFLLLGSGRLTMAPSGPGQGLQPNWLSLVEEEERQGCTRSLDQPCIAI